MTKSKLPDGFTVHNGGAMPIAPDQLVEALIKTNEGIGSAGIRKASEHEWRRAKHPKGIGSVVGYRTAQRGERPLLDLTARL
jgi:hypothetical protein